MRRNGVHLYCHRCGRFTPHDRQGKYGSMGQLLASVERCAVCCAEGGTHELPEGAAPSMRDAGLSRMEIARLCFLRYLIARGLVTEPNGIADEAPAQSPFARPGHADASPFIIDWANIA